MSVNLEDRLRDALRADADQYEPRPDLWADIASQVAVRPERAARLVWPRGLRSTRVLIPAAVVAGLLAVAAAVVLRDGPGGSHRVTVVPPAQMSTLPTVPGSVVPTTQACGQIIFEPNTDNMADRIKATDVGCPEALDLVRKVAQSHNFYSGPRTFETAGYRCVVVTEDPADGLPVGHYACTADTRKVTWDKS